MPVEFRHPNNLETRLFQSFVNLTKQNPTNYPALTSVRVDPSTFNDSLTSYTIYDQYALRVLTNSAPAVGYVTI
jgi:hypothetical protein